MIFRGLCEEMLAAGQGDQPAAVPVRAASNDSFTVTAAQGVEITAAIRSHGAAALNRLWTLKDAIAAAPGAAALARHRPRRRLAGIALAPKGSSPSARGAG